MVVRNFLTMYVLTARTPTGGKTRNTLFRLSCLSILGHFALGQPLALREIPGPDRKNRNFPVLGDPKWKKTCYHSIGDGFPQLSDILSFGRPDPLGREIAKYEYFRPFGPRTALGT